MPKKKLQDSYFLKSEQADKILRYAKERLKQKGVTKKAVWQEIKDSIDPNIPSYPQFLNFLREVDKEKRQRAVAVLEEMKDISGMSDSDLLKTALSGTLKAGNLVVKQTLEEAERLIAEGKPIPEKMSRNIMEWFFKGVDANTKKRSVDIKAKEGELMETIVDNLMQAAQYQKLRGKDDIVDGDFEEIAKKELIKETQEVYGS